jgi:hypothetical protein
MSDGFETSDGFTASDGFEPPFVGFEPPFGFASPGLEPRLSSPPLVEDEEDGRAGPL